MNTTWYLYSHFVWLRLSISSIVKLPFVCLAAHVREFLRWTPVSVKLLLPPRQSRGVSLRTSSYSHAAAAPNELPSGRTLFLHRASRVWRQMNPRRRFSRKTRLANLIF